MLYNKNHLRLVWFFKPPAAVQRQNKKGEIGKTITWLVATVIIIVILLISVFIVSLNLRKNKRFKEFKEGKIEDLLVVKSLSAYLLTKDASGKNVFEQLRDEEKLNDFNGPLALKIFEGLYKKDYQFGAMIGVEIGLGETQNGVFEKIQLKEDKNLELLLRG